MIYGEVKAPLVSEVAKQECAEEEEDPQGCASRCVERLRRNETRLQGSTTMTNPRQLYLVCPFERVS